MCRSVRALSKSLPGRQVVEEAGEGDGGGRDEEAGLQMARQPLQDSWRDAFEKFGPADSHLLLAILVAVAFLLKTKLGLAKST